MKKLCTLIAASLTVSSPAFAGFGTSAAVGGSGTFLGHAPTVDYRDEGWLVQVQALDLIGSIQDDLINTGVSVSRVAPGLKRNIAPEVDGVVMPGGGLRFLADTGFDNVGWALDAHARMGMEMKKGMGFGVYVVPMLGVTNITTGDLGLAYGGGVEISTWLIK